jgi:hypothetical protein
VHARTVDIRDAVFRPASFGAIRALTNPFLLIAPIRLARLQHLGNFQSWSRIPLWNPPPASSLAKQNRLCSLLIRAAARDSRRPQLANRRSAFHHP